MDAKIRDKLLQDAIKEIGKGAIFTLGESEIRQAKIARFNTRIPYLNEIIGGGMPKGRVIEVFGAEGSGKSTLACRLCATRKESLYVDMEGTFDAQIARIHGCKEKNMIIIQPEWGEQGLDILFEYAKAGIPLAIVDSVPTLTPRKEYEGKKGMEGNEGRAMVANLLARKLPVLATLCRKSGTTVVFINQLRDKMDVMAFGEKTRTPGGWSIKHTASLRLKISRIGWLKSSNEVLGQTCRIKVMKSKVCPPFMEADIPLVFESGFVSNEDKTATLQAMRKIKVAERLAQGKSENEGAFILDDDDSEDL